MVAAMTGIVPRLGDVVRISEYAATRFRGAPIARFRVIAAAPLPGRPGWCRLDGWDMDAETQLYERGVAVIVTELTITPGTGWGTPR